MKAGDSPFGTPLAKPIAVLNSSNSRNLEQRSIFNLTSFDIPLRVRQYLLRNTIRLMSGQNSFKMLNAPSRPIWATHFWPVLVQGARATGNMCLRLPRQRRCR